MIPLDDGSRHSFMALSQQPIYSFLLKNEQEFAIYMLACFLHIKSTHQLGTKMTPKILLALILHAASKQGLPKGPLRLENEPILMVEVASTNPLV